MQMWLCSRRPRSADSTRRRQRTQDKGGKWSRKILTLLRWDHHGGGCISVSPLMSLLSLPFQGTPQSSRNREAKMEAHVDGHASHRPSFKNSFSLDISDTAVLTTKMNNTEKYGLSAASWFIHLVESEVADCSAARPHRGYRAGRFYY